MKKSKKGIEISSWKVGDADGFQAMDPVQTSEDTGIAECYDFEEEHDATQKQKEGHKEKGVSKINWKPLAQKLFCLPLGVKNYTNAVARCTKVRWDYVMPKMFLPEVMRHLEAKPGNVIVWKNLSHETEHQKSQTTSYKTSGAGIQAKPSPIKDERAEGLRDASQDQRGTLVQIPAKPSAYSEWFLPANPVNLPHVPNDSFQTFRFIFMSSTQL